jgi:hypothetical protein
MKNIYILLVLLVISNSMYSQADLHVGASSYIFVDGDGFTSGAANVAPLFVTDNVNLEGNLYLRDDAQLLQGSGTTGNSGLGTLSVYQEGTVNEFAYNYWSSPVGNIDASTSGNRPFRANLLHDPLLGTARLIDSQIALFTTGSGGSSAPLTISDRWIYTFEASDEYSEWGYVGETAPVTVGLGFTMKGTSGSGLNQEYDFRGKPNTGEINVPVAAPVATVGQWTLTGNPYPSAIDAFALIWDLDNINNTAGDPTDDLTTGVLYFWEQDPTSASHYTDDYVGGYASFTIDQAQVESSVLAMWYNYNPDGTVNGGALNVGIKYPRRYITIGQGFMVEGLNAGNFKIKNSHRLFYKETSGTSEFFEANDASQNLAYTDNANNDGDNDIPVYIEVPEDYNRFRLFVEFNDTYTRELLHNFHASATNGFDLGLEAKSPAGVSSDAYWILNETPYVIQAHSFDESLKIPLVINLTEDMPLNLRLADIQHFDESIGIYLHDMENNLYVNLREQNYDMILEAGNYPDRFEITFTEDTLSNTVFNLDNLKVYQNNTASELTILNPNGLEINSVTLLDVAGKQIFKELTESQNDKLTFSTNTLSEGVYIATITIGNSKTISEKVIVKNKY